MQKTNSFGDMKKSGQGLGDLLKASLASSFTGDQIPSVGRARGLTDLNDVQTFANINERASVAINK